MSEEHVIVAMTREELERDGPMDYDPGTEFIPCSMCGEEVVISPATRDAAGPEARAICQNCLPEHQKTHEMDFADLSHQQYMEVMRRTGLSPMQIRAFLRQQLEEDARGRS